MQMIDFILFSLKSGLCLILFYAFYRFVLSKETHVKRNRIYLLAAILFSLVLPFINFTIENEELAKANQVVWEFENTIQDQFVIEESNSLKGTVYDFSFWMITLYSSGIILVLGRLFLNLISIFKIIRANEIKKEGALNLIYLEQVHSPYSFFNYVFLNPSILSKTENKQILLHESIHSKQLHSIDLLIIELLKAFFWFNPIIYLLKNALVEVHEYCADQACVTDDANKIGYQQCLVQHIESKMNFNLTSAFKSSLILKRIKMIKKSNTSVWAHLKLILILPVLIISMLSFDYAEIKKDKSENLNSKTKFSLPLKPSVKLKISAGYGWRVHQIYKTKKFHNGIDISGSIGTPVYAIADGVVNLADAKGQGGYGKYIVIVHADGYASRYAHLSKLSINVKANVKRGDLIAYVGNTGKSTGPHLHFEIKKNGNNVNPSDLIDFTKLTKK